MAKKRSAPGGGPVRPTVPTQNKKRRRAGQIGVVLFTEVRGGVQSLEKEFVAAINVRCEPGCAVPAGPAVPAVREAFVAFVEGNSATRPKRADVMADWAGVRAALCQRAYDYLAYAQKVVPPLLPSHQEVLRRLDECLRDDAQSLVRGLLHPAGHRGHYLVYLGEMKRAWSVGGSPAAVTVHFTAAARMLAHVELGDIASHSDSGVRQRALAQLSAQRERYAPACVDAEIAADQGVFTAVMREMLARERAPVAASRHSSQSNRLPRGDVSCAPPVKQMAVVSSVVELDEE